MGGGDRVCKGPRPPLAERDRSHLWPTKSAFPSFVDSYSTTSLFTRQQTAERGQPGQAASSPRSGRWENHESRLIAFKQCLTFPYATFSVDKA